MTKERTLIYVGYDFGPEVDQALKSSNGERLNLSGVNYSKKAYTGITKSYEKIVSLLFFPRGWWPKKSKVFFQREHKTDKNSAISVPYINVAVLKTYSMARSLKRRLNNLIKSGCINVNEPIDLFLSESKTSYLLFSKYAKKKLRNLVVITDVQDVPTIFYERLKGIEKLRKIDSRKALLLLRSQSDGYVLLSPYMMSIIKSQKPYIVSEGICESTNYEDTCCIDSNSYHPHSVVYTGVLSEDRASISLLINAYLLVKRKISDSELLLAGSPETDVIKNFDGNYGIKYLGNLSPNEAKLLQNSAGVLINLRKDSDSFKYAFPSKITDYIQTGKPIIQSNLKFLPEEYKEILFIPNELTVEKIRDLIIHAFSLTTMERQEIANKSKKLVAMKSPYEFGVNVRTLFSKIRLVNKEWEKSR